MEYNLSSTTILVRQSPGLSVSTTHSLGHNKHLIPFGVSIKYFAGVLHFHNLSGLYNFKSLTKLDDRSRDIIQQRWLTDDKATLHQLADKYQVSAERIRQLENNAIKKLKLAMT